MVSDLTIKILEEIRDAVQGTNERLDRHIEITETRFDSVDKRFESIENRFESIEHRFESIENRIVEGEIRAATIMMDISGQLRELAKSMRGRRALTERVEKCEKDIRRLKERTGCP